MLVEVRPRSLPWIAWGVTYLSCRAWWSSFGHQWRTFRGVIVPSGPVLGLELLDRDLLWIVQVPMVDLGGSSSHLVKERAYRVGFFPAWVALASLQDHLELIKLYVAPATYILGALLCWSW